MSPIPDCKPCTDLTRLYLPLSFLLFPCTSLQLYMQRELSSVIIYDPSLLELLYVVLSRAHYTLDLQLDPIGAL